MEIYIADMYLLDGYINSDDDNLPKCTLLSKNKNYTLGIINTVVKLLTFNHNVKYQPDNSHWVCSNNIQMGSIFECSLTMKTTLHSKMHLVEMRKKRDLLSYNSPNKTLPVNILLGLKSEKRDQELFIEPELLDIAVNNINFRR